MKMASTHRLRNGARWAEHDISAQAIFPLWRKEMAGNPKENEIAGAVHDRIDAAWPILAKRVRVIPAYGDMFVKAFDDIDSPEQITIVEIAKALGDFINLEWQSFDSPYDAFLTSGKPLDPASERGRQFHSLWRGRLRKLP